MNEGQEDQKSSDSPKADPEICATVLPETESFYVNEGESDVDSMSVSAQVQRSCSERQIYSTDIDVLNNLIHALEET